MTIIFEAQNANEDFIKLVKNAAKLANVKLKTQKKENEQEFYTLETSAAIKKIRAVKLSDKEERQIKEEVLKECGL